MRQEPEGRDRLPAATVKGWKDVIADPKLGIAAAKKRDPLIDEALETERLQISLQTNILTPYVKANGMGDVDPARFARSVKDCRRGLRPADRAGARQGVHQQVPAAQGRPHGREVSRERMAAQLTGATRHGRELQCASGIPPRQPLPQRRRDARVHAFVDLDGVSLAYGIGQGRDARAGRCDAHHRQGRVHRRRRPLGLRQVHPDEAGHRPAAAAPAARCRCAARR